MEGETTDTAEQDKVWPHLPLFGRESSQDSKFPPQRVHTLQEEASRVLTTPAHLAQVGVCLTQELQGQTEPLPLPEGAPGVLG